MFTFCLEEELGREGGCLRREEGSLKEVLPGEKGVEACFERNNLRDVFDWRWEFINEGVLWENDMMLSVVETERL